MRKDSCWVNLGAHAGAGQPASSWVTAPSHCPQIPCRAPRWAIIFKMWCSSCQQRLSTDFCNVIAIRKLKFELSIWKRSIWVKIGDIWSRVTLKFDRWPCKTIGHLFYATSIFLAQFQSHWWIQIGVIIGKGSVRVKIGNFLFRVTLKFDGLPWKNRTHFLCYFKLCGSFHSHWWIQTRVTVWKFSIRVTIDNLCPVWSWNLMDEFETELGSSSMPLQALCIIA